MRGPQNVKAQRKQPHLGLRDGCGRSISSLSNRDARTYPATITGRLKITVKASPRLAVRRAGSSSVDMSYGCVRCRQRERANSFTMMIENEHTQRRRKVGAPPVSVDVRKKLRDGGVPLRSDGFDLRPKCVFEANARLVTVDDDGSFDDRRVHREVPLFDYYYRKM